MEALENKIAKMIQEFISLRKDQYAYIQAQKLTEQLLDQNIKEDVSADLLGSDKIVFCKRTKYLEKAWLLLAKDNQY